MQNNKAEVSAGKLKQCNCKRILQLPTSRLLCRAAVRVSLTGSLYNQSNKQVVIHHKLLCRHGPIHKQPHLKTHHPKIGVLESPRLKMAKVFPVFSTDLQFGLWFSANLNQTGNEQQFRFIFMSFHVKTTLPTIIPTLLQQRAEITVTVFVISYFISLSNQTEEFNPT